jgi:hypothetical protein
VLLHLLRGLPNRNQGCRIWFHTTKVVRLSTLLVRHLRHASILTTLILLLLELLVVQGLLLLLMGHVASLLGGLAGHGWGLRHALDVVGRGDVISTVGTVLAGWLGGVQAGLDEILAFGFGDEGLELGGGEGVDEAGLGDDEEEDLCAGEDGEFVGLGGVSVLVMDGRVGGLTFFMIPAFLFENVM